jgi:hypothetical protein
MLWWLLLGYAMVSVVLSALIGTAVRLRDRAEAHDRTGTVALPSADEISGSAAEKAPRKALCPALVTADEADVVPAAV